MSQSIPGICLCVTLSHKFGEETLPWWVRPPGQHHEPSALSSSHGHPVRMFLRAFCRDFESDVSFSTKAKASKPSLQKPASQDHLRIPLTVEQSLFHSHRCCILLMKEFLFLPCALPKIGTSKTTTKPGMTTFRRYGFRLFLSKKLFHNDEKTNSTSPLH